MSIFEFHGYKLDIGRCRVWQGEERLELEPQVYGLLELLVKNHGQIVTRDEMIAAIWDGRIVSNSTIDNRIRALRSAIDDDGRRQRFIKTYPNRGYKFVGNVQLMPEPEPGTTASNPEPVPEPEQSLEPANESVAEAVMKDIVEKAPLPQKRRPTLVTALQFLSVAVMASLLVLVAPSFFSGKETTVETAETVEARQSKNRTPSLESIYTATGEIDPNASVRILLAPATRLGDNTRYPYLQDVLEGEVSTALRSIDRVSVITAPGSDYVPSEQAQYSEIGKDFGADLVLVTKAVSLGEFTRFQMDLICAFDDAVLWSGTYPLSIDDDKTIENWTNNTAMEITTGIALKLQRPFDVTAPIVASYEVQKIVARANDLLVNYEKEDIETAITMLNEAVQMAPNYLPALSALFKAHYDSLSYASRRPESNDIVLIQADLFKTFRKIYALAPESPQAYIAVSQMTEVVGDDDDALFKEIIGPDKNAFDVMEEGYGLWPEDVYLQAARAHLHYFHPRPMQQRVDVLEESLRYNPTDPVILSYLGQLYMCNGDSVQASETLKRAKAWHPNHRDTLLLDMKLALETLDQDRAAELAKAGLSLPNERFYEQWFSRALFKDIGPPDNYTDLVPLAPYRHDVHVMHGDMEGFEAARLEAPNRISVKRALAILGDETSWAEAIHKSIDNGYAMQSPTVFEYCNQHRELWETYTLAKAYPDIYEADMETIIETTKQVLKEEGFITRTSYLSQLFISMYEGDTDSALDLLDKANANKIVFLGFLSIPVVNEIKNVDGFEERYAVMKARSEQIHATVNFEDITAAGDQVVTD